MRKFIALAALLAGFAAAAVEVKVDIFRDEKDPRVTVFTIPASEKDAPVKNFVMMRDGKKYSPQVQKISLTPMVLCAGIA